MKKSLKDIVKYIFIAAFLGMLFLKDFIGVGIPSIAFMITWIGLIFVADQDTALSFTLAVDICFASTISVTIPTAIFIVYTLFKRRDCLKLNGIFLISVLIAFVEFCRLFNVTENFRQYVNSMMFVFIVLTAINEMYEENCNPVKCLKYYLCFFAFLTLDVIYATAKSLGGLGSIVSEGFRIGQADFADKKLEGLLGMNSNGMALLSIAAICVCLVLLSKKHMSAIWSWIIIAYATLVGLLTVSKSFFLVFVGVIVLYVFWISVKNRGNVLKTGAIVLMIAIVLFALSKTTVVSNVIARFNEGSDISTGRTEVAKEYLQYMKDNPGKVFFGVGLQDITTKTGFVHVPHNAIVEIFVTLGLFGIVAYTAFFVLILRMGKKIRKNNDEKNTFINHIPFIAFFVFIQGLQFLRISYIYTSIAIVFACLIVSVNKTKQDEIIR